ncbi:MAG: diguanylate cyclase [Aquabacterium sp.]
MLRFPAPLELAYRSAFQAQRQVTLTKGLAFCAPLYLILLWVDHEMLPGSQGLSLWLRLGVFMPLLALGAWAMLFKVRSPLLREWLFAGLAGAACLISVLVSVGAEGELRVQHLVILNAIVIYAVLYGRFWPMVCLCTAVFDMHLLAVHHIGSLLSGIGVGTTLLLLANCTYMVYGSYLLEQAARTSFLVDLQEAEMDAELTRATECLGRMAREDALTGLANRRHFTEFLREAHARALVEGSPLALVLIDVDHFKAYNDHHGHPAGDECLHRVGQALRSAAREPVDLVARWGGEEFAVVLQDVDQDRAMQTAERMRMALCESAIPHAASQTDGIVTISLGVAMLDPDTQVPPVAQPGDAGIAALLARADQALYVSKTSGRNRVTLAQPDDAAATAPSEAARIESVAH